MMSYNLHIPVTLNRIQVAMLARAEWGVDELGIWDEKYTAETGLPPGGIYREMLFMCNMGIYRTGRGYLATAQGNGIRETYGLLIYCVAKAEFGCLQLAPDPCLAQGEDDDSWLDADQPLRYQS